MAWVANFYLNTHVRANFNPLQRPQRSGTIFMLSLCHNPQCQCLLERSLYMCLIPQIYVGATQGTFLDHLALVASRVCSWVPGDCNKWRDNYWPATIPKALHRKQTKKHTPVFLWKRLICLSFSLRCRFLFGTHPRMKAKGCHVCALPLPCYRLLYLPERNLYIHLALQLLRLLQRGQL